MLELLCHMLQISRSRKTDARAGNAGPANVPGGSLSEVFASTPADAAAVGFVLAHLSPRPGPVLWVQDRLSRKEAGRPCLSGHGGRRADLLRMDLMHPRDVLIAAEDGLRCAALSAVVIEIWGDPPALSFTATKRLTLRAEASGVSCWLIRRCGTPGLSAARDRWRAASLPSLPDPDDPAAPGDPRWHMDLFRSRDKRPGAWVATHDRAADRVDFVAAVCNGTLAETGETLGQRAAR
jgi:protein ImuA